MQLRLSLPLVNATGFKNSTSGLLTAITVGGAFSTVIFSSTKINSDISEKFKSTLKIFQDSFFYDGIKRVGETFNDWGKAIIIFKDEFKDWFHRYLNASGLKFGIVTLYEKLVVWGTIVYEWFRDKFLIFIKNIPEMVKKWDQLRLSLFKWGTFLGGGGGSALWSMFGSGDNWGKLGGLLGNSEFGDIAEKFGQLMEDNPKAFADMSEEEARAIFEKMLGDPEQANKNLEDLLQKQKEMKDKPEEEQELKKEEIIDKLTSGGGGNPSSPKDALWNFAGSGLQAVLDSSGDTPFKTAQDAMKKHLETLKREAKWGDKSSKVKEHFLKALEGGKEEQLIKAFAYLANSAYNSYNQSEKKDRKMLARFFEEHFKNEYTEDGGNEENGVEVENKIKIK